MFEYMRNRILLTDIANMVPALLVKGVESLLEELPAGRNETKPLTPRVPTGSINWREILQHLQDMQRRPIVTGAGLLPSWNTGD